MRRTVEETRPEQAAAAIDAATDPFVSVRAAAKEAGLPLSTTQQLIKRLEARYRPLNNELKTLKTKELLAMIDDRLHRALNYLDDYVLCGASARDLAVITGVLFDKRQLLSSQPTQIRSFAQARDDEETVMLLLVEMKSRGLIEGDFRVIGCKQDGLSPPPVKT